MKFKIHYNSNKAFTLVELVVSISALLLISSVLLLNVNPGESKKKSRDNKRLLDISEIERSINEYMLDNNSYPGVPNVLYKSTNINWIPSSLSKYISVLPIDPLNTSDNYYYYINNGNSYEITARLEYFSDLMANDNGNQQNTYEVGNNLNLISDN